MTAAPDGLGGRRLLAHPLGRAVVEVTNERGYELADTRAFAHRAGIAEAEIHAQFADKRDLVLAVLEAAIADFRARVGAAFEAGEVWPDNLRGAAYETARWLLEHPGQTRFVVVSTAGAGDMARARREELYLWGATLIDQGRAFAPLPEKVPALAGIVAIGAVVEGLRRQQEGSLGGGIVEAIPRLLYAAVRPYLGESAARRELARPLPADLERLRSG